LKFALARNKQENDLEDKMQVKLDKFAQNLERMQEVKAKRLSHINNVKKSILKLSDGNNSPLRKKESTESFKKSTFRMPSLA